MIVWIITRRVGRETARRAMFESLIDRQDHQFPGAGQLAAPQQPGDVGLRSGIVTAVVTQNFLYAISHVDRKSTRLNSSHVEISYAVFCLKKKKKKQKPDRS